MEKKVLSYIQKNHMIEHGDMIIAGVSGGADSVCLLLLLARLREELGIRLQAVHVNHHLRAEASADEAYVQNLCMELSVPLQVVHVQVEEYAAVRRIGCEEAGRELRYQAFYEIAKGLEGRVKIAVAHHQDDQAETVLFHLLRGTGLSGLSGIRPVRDKIIRPLLCLTRKEIEKWLKKENVTYCMDWTNLEDTYTRNKIRHHILPYAETEICSRAVAHIAKTAEICGEAEDYLRQQTAIFYDKCVINEKLVDQKLEKTKHHKRQIQQARRRILIPVFLAEHPLLQKRLLLRVFEELLPQRRDVEAAHVEAVLSLFSKESGKQLSLPKGLTARKEYDTVVIEKTEGEPEQKKEVVSLIIPEGQSSGSLLLPGGLELVWNLLSAPKIEENLENIPKKPYTKWFDYDKIKESMAVRTRSKGDYLTIRITEENRFAKKPLKKYFITEKVPLKERDNILLLAEGAHVLWVMGYRISEYYKVTAATKRILQVQLRGEQTDG